MRTSSAPIRHSHSLGSNPWIFLNPSFANALLVLFVTVALLIDVIIIFIHWNISSCSNILKLWIVGKYVAPFLSYLSCCLFMPCNLEEAMEVSTSIPYSQHALRQRRIRQHVLDLDIVSQIRSNSTANDHAQRDDTSNNHIQMGDARCCDMPYPYDVMLSEWCVSPSSISTHIAESADNVYCKLYIYCVAILFDRGILELIWLFVGGLSIVTEDVSCRDHTPVLYYYVLLQIILGAVITFILVSWMLSSSWCPLQVARLLACCYGMECDILGILPRHLFQRLLTMHNTWNANHEAAQYNRTHIANSNKNNNYNTSMNHDYHALYQIPHHYEQSENTVELTTNKSSKRKRTLPVCVMCDHEMEYLCGDTSSLECGHEFHSVCIDAWPINLQCPQCAQNAKNNHQRKNNDENTENTNHATMGLEDSDDQLDAESEMGSNLQLL